LLPSFATSVALPDQLWNHTLATGDLAAAEEMVARARAEIETEALDELSRENLRRMMSAVVDRHRANGAPQHH
jgi:hypothetical protein